MATDARWRASGGARLDNDGSLSATTAPLGVDRRHFCRASSDEAIDHPAPSLTGVATAVPATPLPAAPLPDPPSPPPRRCLTRIDSRQRDGCRTCYLTQRESTSARRVPGWTQELPRRYHASSGLAGRGACPTKSPL